MTQYFSKKIRISLLLFSTLLFSSSANAYVLFNGSCFLNLDFDPVPVALSLCDAADTYSGPPPGVATTYAMQSAFEIVSNEQRDYLGEEISDEEYYEMDSSEQLQYNFSSMVKPYIGSFAGGSFFVIPLYSKTRISASESMLNETHKISTPGIILGLNMDYSDWGYQLQAPIHKVDNTSTYSAFDNTNVGLTFSPYYNLLVEQVHGISAVVGGRVGYRHTFYDDSTAGSDFSDTSTTFISAFAKMSKFIGPNTRARLRLEVMTHKNHQNESFLGTRATSYIAGVGLDHRISDKLTLFSDFSATNIHLDYFDYSDTTGKINVGLAKQFSARSALSLEVGRTLLNDTFSTTTAMASFVWQID